MVTRRNDLLSGPVSRPTAGSLGPATGRSGHVRGLCPWCCRAGGSPCRLPGRRAAWPRARWPARLALAAARRAARAVCRRPGCAAAASGSSSPGGVPGDLAGCAAGVSRRPGTSARCLAARGLAPSRIRRRCAHRIPIDARDRVRAGCLPGPAPDDRPAPPSRAAGGGHDTGAAVTCAFTAVAGIWRGCPGHPRSCRHGLAGLALAGCQCLLRAAVSPTGPPGPARVFSNYTALAGEVFTFGVDLGGRGLAGGLPAG